MIIFNIKEARQISGSVDLTLNQNSLLLFCGLLQKLYINLLRPCLNINKHKTSNVLVEKVLFSVVVDFCSPHQNQSWNILILTESKCLKDILF